MSMFRSGSFQLMHNFDRESEPKGAKFPILKGSFGADIYILAKDREILTNPEETKRRRAIRLMRDNHSTWGFMLQTYGIRNKRTGEVEIMTYVDFVELHSPAWIAGMQCGDIILSVNGESVDNLSHHDLASKIKKSGLDLRLVVLFENCCSKVALQERYLKLKKLLKLKLKELYYLEEEESKLKGEIILSRYDILKPIKYSSVHSDWDAYTEMTYLRQCYQPSKTQFDLVSSELSSSLSSDISKKIYSLPAEEETCSYVQDNKMNGFTTVNGLKAVHNIGKDHSFNEKISSGQLDMSDVFVGTEHTVMIVSDKDTKSNSSSEICNCYTSDISKHDTGMSHFVQSSVNCYHNVISGFDSDKPSILCKHVMKEEENGRNILEKQNYLDSHSDGSKNIVTGPSSQILLPTENVFISSNLNQSYFNPEILNVANVHNSLISSTGPKFKGILVNDTTLSTQL